jgi:hypothetical protein
MAAVQLVGAVREDHEHGLAAEAPGEEGQERAGRTVGPVDVLQRKDDRTALAEALEQREQRLEEPALGRAALIVADRLRGSVAAGGELGDERRQLGAGRRAEPVEHRIAGAGERAQRADERRVGQLALAQLNGVPADDDRVLLVAGAALELGQEPALADAGLAGDEGERRLALLGLAQGRLQLGELVRPADQASARDAGRHDLQYAPPTRSSGAPPPASCYDLRSRSRRRAAVGTPGGSMTRGSQAKRCETRERRGHAGRAQPAGRGGRRETRHAGRDRDHEPR